MHFNKNWKERLHFCFKFDRNLVGVFDVKVCSAALCVTFGVEITSEGLQYYKELKSYLRVLRRIRRKSGFSLECVRFIEQWASRESSRNILFVRLTGIGREGIPAEFKIGCQRGMWSFLQASSSNFLKILLRKKSERLSCVR